MSAKRPTFNDRPARWPTAIWIACLAATIVFAIPIAGLCDELTSSEARTIARDAFVFGLPIVDSYQTMYAFAIDKKNQEFQAPFNTLRHETKIVTPADTTTLTPNIDIFQSFLWLDLRIEPVVLGVPELETDRYYSVQLIDLYKQTCEYIGSRATGNGAGRYLVAGPQWVGEIPPNVDGLIRCHTAFVMAIYRTQLRGPNDVEAVEKIQAGYTVQTLSAFLGAVPSSTQSRIPVIDEFPPPPEEGTPGLDFLSTLSFLLPYCDFEPAEEEILQRMARIGVKTDARFETDAFSDDIVTALRSGMEQGAADVTSASSTLQASELNGPRKESGDDYVRRAVLAKIGRYNHLKQEALYPFYRTDGEGLPLDASTADYVLRLKAPELPPVNAFWSLTMYDGPSQLLVANPLARYQINSSTLSSLTKNADGGVSIYLQHKSPPADQMANWLPAPDGPFYLVLRLYWPQPAAYDGTWSPPLIWPADAPTLPQVSGDEVSEEVKPSLLSDEPQPEMKRPTVWGEPTEVQIGIYVIDVDEISSADQSFAASVFYQARWKNPLLRHKGPGPLKRGISEVWTPRLTIVGQQMAWQSFPEAVEIQPDGTVVYRQKIWGRFSQPLQLHDFPFDKQVLSIHVVAAGLLEEHVKMVPLVNESGGTSGMARTFSLPDFNVLSFEAAAVPYYPGNETRAVAGYEVKIQVARQATYYILKVIIPLCLIVVMSWLPRWLDPEQAGTNIGIATSSFLTLVAYLFAITVLLPRVSYVTRMDRFILLSTLTVFAGLLQTAANTMLVKRRKKVLVERTDRWSRLVYVILLALILGYSFVV